MGGAKELLLPMAAPLRQPTLRALFGGLLPTIAAGLLLLPIPVATAAPKHGAKATKAKCKPARGHRARRPSRACAKARRSKPKLQIETEFTGAATSAEPATESKSTAPGHPEPRGKPNESSGETTTETPPPTTESPPPEIEREPE